MNTTSAYIPGFQGYASREVRAQAERSLRAHLAKELTAQRDRLAEVEVDFLARDDHRFAEVDRAVWEMQLTIDVLDDSEGGTGPWLSRTKLRDEDLQLLHQIDLALLRGGDEVRGKTDEIVASYRAHQSLAASVGDLVYILLDMTDKIEQRKEIIREPLP